LVVESGVSECVRGVYAQWAWDAYTLTTPRLHVSTLSHTLLSPPSSSQGILRGVMSRVSGADGFQLVNVTNAQIILIEFSDKNWLVNRVGRGGKKGRNAT
jgi:hypothetical protein